MPHGTGVGGSGGGWRPGSSPPGLPTLQISTAPPTTQTRETIWGCLSGRRRRSDSTCPLPSGHAAPARLWAQASAAPHPGLWGEAHFSAALSLVASCAAAEERRSPLPGWLSPGTTTGSISAADSRSDTVLQALDSLTSRSASGCRKLRPLGARGTRSGHPLPAPLVPQNIPVMGERCAAFTVLGETLGRGGSLEHRLRILPAAHMRG